MVVGLVTVVEQEVVVVVVVVVERSDQTEFVVFALSTQPIGRGGWGSVKT